MVKKRRKRRGSELSKSAVLLLQLFINVGAISAICLAYLLLTERISLNVFSDLWDQFG